MTRARAAHFLHQCASALTGASEPPIAPVRATEHSAPRNAGGDERILGEITLLPHQVEGAHRLRAMLGVHGGALLADDVGVGKTFTALQLARNLPRVLIIAPATLCPMWQDACRRATVEAHVTSYERLSAGNLPRAQPWTLVILDEAHHARTPSTRRYAALCDITRGAQVLLLTATPIHNRIGDLQALLALFLGEGAQRLDSAALSALIVRRQVGDLDYPLPELQALHRHAVPHASGVLRALRALPPPFPPADSGVAYALVVLQLTRAWCSSDAALLAAIRNRLATAAALEQALESGRLPTRRDLSSWSAGSDGSVQLAFPELVAGPASSPASVAALAVVRAHANALRQLRALVRGPASRDGARMDTLARILHASAVRQTVVFTHSAVTAEHAFRALLARFRVALLTGRGAHVASGPIPRLDVLRQFAPDGRSRAADGTRGHPSSAPTSDALRIDVLIASDVVSEGVDLQRAGAVVHLDLPWTMARLEQRIGRVRRMGSSHAAVASHLIAPPVDADELQLTLAHLAHKSSAAGRTVGRSTILGDPAAWTGVLPDLPAHAPATVRHTLVDALRQLAACASPTGRSPCRPTPRSPHGRAPPALVRWKVLARASPRAFALVTIGEVAHVLCATPTDVAMDPSTVLAHVQEVLEDARSAARRHAEGEAERHAKRHAKRHAEPDAPPDARAQARTAQPIAQPDRTDCARILEASVRRWVSQRSAAELLSLPDARNSASHRRLLHAIDRITACAPRTRRAQLSTAAAVARTLVARQRGAGSERLLHALLGAAPNTGADVDAALRWLERVRASLHDAGAPPAAGEHPASASRGVTLHGMLTLLLADSPR